MLASLLLVVSCSSTGAVVSIAETPHHGATTLQPAAEEAPLASGTTASVARRIATLRRRFQIWARWTIGAGRPGHGPGLRLLRPLLEPLAPGGSTVLRL